MESISIAELHAAKTSLTSALRSLKAGITAAGTDALAQEPEKDPKMVAAAPRAGCRYGSSGLSQQPLRNSGPSKRAKAKPRAVLPQKPHQKRPRRDETDGVSASPDHHTGMQPGDEPMGSCSDSESPQKSEEEDAIQG